MRFSSRGLKRFRLHCRAGGGAALGGAPAPPGYFQAIREICDRYDVLFIADEVMCGLAGRAPISRSTTGRLPPT